MRSARYIYIAIILSCLVGFNRFMKAPGMSSSNEFRVLIVKGEPYKLKRGKKLEIGDNVNKKDVIILPQNSYLCLVHKSGETFNFFGETETKIKIKDIIATNGNNIYLNIEQLKLTELPVSQVEVISDIEIYYPLGINWYGKKICVKWFDRKKEINSKYEIILQNLALDTLFVQKLSKQQYIIDIEKHAQSNKIIDKSLLLSIRKVNHHETSTELHAISFAENTITLVKGYACGPKEPSDNVVVGLYLEQKYAFEEAAIYYKNAVELSGNEAVFIEIYDNFLKRKSSLGL